MRRALIVQLESDPEIEAVRALLPASLVLAGSGDLQGGLVQLRAPRGFCDGRFRERALAIDGVHAVITGKDMPIPYGIIPWTPDETALAVDKVCYVGDGVAAVAAIDEDTAIAALAAIEVLYEPLVAYYDPEEALAGEVTINPFQKRGNLSKDVVLEFGDALLAPANLGPLERVELDVHARFPRPVF